MNNGSPFTPEARARILAGVRREKLHRRISYVKSWLRIVGYMYLPWNLWAATVVLVVSEILGIAEEVFGS